jgi:hypothetical protein
VYHPCWAVIWMRTFGCNAGRMAKQTARPMSDEAWHELLLNAGLLERPGRRARAWCPRCRRMVTGRMVWHR